MIKLNQFHFFYFQLYVQLLLYILCSTCSNPNLFIILHSNQNYPCFFSHYSSCNAFLICILPPAPIPPPTQTCHPCYIEPCFAFSFFNRSLIWIQVLLTSLMLSFALCNLKGYLRWLNSTSTFKITFSLQETLRSHY